MPTNLLRVMLLGGAGALTLLSAAPAARAQSAGSTQRQIEDLRRLIEQQQQTIDDLKERVQELQGQQTEMKTSVDENKEAISRADKALITSSSDNLVVNLSGQVSRLLNLADDGKSTKAYFVDNDISVSRLRLFATGQVNDDFSIGSNIELAISPNNSEQVSQDNEEGSQDDEFRKVEALFTSKSWGEVRFGRGDPATKDIARLDLSDTDILAYASTGDIAGGLLFRTDDEELTETDIDSVFTDFDSSRQNRIRYNSPSFYGAFGSASYGADQTWGVAARWAGTGHGLEATGGVGVQEPSESATDLIYAGSGSVLHEGTGLNLTYATAWQDQDEGTGQLQYVKAGWQHGFFDFGDTAFSIDFGLNKDTPADGDDGKTIGLAAVQDVDGYGTELFLGFRGYDLDPGEGPSTETIYVGTAGTRIRF